MIQPLPEVFRQEDEHEWTITVETNEDIGVVLRRVKYEGVS